MTHLSYELAAALYLAASVLGSLPRAGERAARGVIWLLGAGVLLHAVGFVELHRQTPPVPLDSFPAALSLIAWLTAAGYLLSLEVARVRAVGPWVGAVAGVLTLAADLALRWTELPAPGPQDSVAWSHAHVLLSSGGFSVLALASLAGLAYLTKERELKRKRRSRFTLPSLESLDRFEHVSLSLGFPLLTLGVVTGFVWGASRGVSLWTGHSLLLLVAWAVYLLPLSLRVLRHQRGHEPARDVVLGFAVLAFSYIGIRLLGTVA
jgi:ABC-type uncharacterized transport system permease subunit